MSKTKNGIDYFGVNVGGSAREHIIKTLNIGVWNMDTTTGVTVSHGLTSTEWPTITDISGVIRNDDDNTYYIVTPDGGGSLNSDCYINSFNSSTISIIRKTSGFFDSANFDLTTGSYNRGFITFYYTPA